MTRKIAILLSLIALSVGAPAMAARTSRSEIENYIAPYVKTNNFSGVILAASNGSPVFARAYGLADRQKRVPNKLNTRFHVASMSMQFTAAAILRLIDGGRLKLDMPVSAVVPDFPRGRDITIQNLLTQTSGIADINALPDYEKVLQRSQSPASLVAKVANLPTAHETGKFESEEHSAYNLLALILESKTGLPFAAAVRKLVFTPLGMNNSGIDDDRVKSSAGMACGYAPEGVFGVDLAKPIHWSAKAGNGSAYTTAGDELRWINGLFRTSFLSPGLRTTMFDLSARAGYGWFKFKSRRFNETMYSMNGRAPGFASALDYLPERRLLVVVLSNIYASVPTPIADDIAASMLKQPYEHLALMDRPPEASTLAGLPNSFRFPHDFYQKDALVTLENEGQQAVLKWPSGETSPLIPVANDRYVDRSYWIPVEVIRDANGSPVQLKYDRFVGDRERE